MRTLGRNRRALLALASFPLACAGGLFGLGESVPAGRLPADVRPLHYDLALEIDPAKDEFAGVVTIDLDLDRSRETLWLHGQGLTVGSVRLDLPSGESLEAEWEPSDASGVAAVRLPRAVGPGRAALRATWRAPFANDLRGLYRVERGGAAWAFTQFEPVSARRVFPGFDEPAFKTPFDVTLTVPSEAVAIAGTPSVSEETLPDARRRIRFATSKPLPTYLLVFAVGPLDVVAGRALPSADGAVPFRGAAVAGRGAELTYALENTAPYLEALEDYFGSPYPYAKLDVIAVPDFGAGAMENAGAITFRDSLLLVDTATASERQLRRFASVMAHELAHQWFGNLVTMPWWNDIWLNEAFASWMERRAVEAVAPEYAPALSQLTAVQGAMGSDALASARSIRQPVEDVHDIYNAFDGITYSKGAGVLAMFERWLGAETFRSGVRRYLEEHRFGTATAEDLLAALSAEAGRDVSGPFETFLTQPGVPLVEARIECKGLDASLHVRQSRYRPLGSATRDSLWQIPLCARYRAGGETHETCQLLTAREQSIPLEGGACPEWLHPNADAAGYYRWALSESDAESLASSGWSELTPRERLSLANNLQAAFRAGALSPESAYGAMPVLARDPERLVATAPLEPMRFARVHLADDATRPAVESFARALYTARLAELGWNARPGESGERKLLRASVIAALAGVARDPEVRAEAARRGRRYAGIGGPREPRAVEPDYAATALIVAVQDGGPADFDAILALLRESEDAVERGRMLRALGSVWDPVLAARARALSLDPELRQNEVLAPLYAQTWQPETRDEAWRWVRENFDAVAERIGAKTGGHMPWLAGAHCDEASAEEIEDFFRDRIDALEGGPRNLAAVLEKVRLCAALVEAQGAPTRSYFSDPRTAE